MARVRWGTHCEGFCSKEGLHYHIEWTNWNVIKCKKCLWSHPEAVSARQATINLDSQLWNSFGDSLPELYCIDLAEAYVMQENVSLRNIAWEEKVLPTDVPMRNLRQKAEWETGTNSCTRFPWESCFKKTCHVCQKYGGACTTWYSENQRYKKWDERLDSRKAKKGPKKLVSSDSAKILEKESSN